MKSGPTPGRALVILGYLIVAIGSSFQAKLAIQIVLGFDVASSAYVFYFLSVPIAYGVSAWSWWWFARATSNDERSTVRWRRGLRGLSLQSLVLACGSVLLAHEGVLSSRQSVLVAGEYVSFTGGLVLTLGFWILASSVDRGAAVNVNQRVEVQQQAEVQVRPRSMALVCGGYLVMALGFTVQAVHIVLETSSLGPAAHYELPFGSGAYLFSIPVGYIIATWSWRHLVELQVDSSTGASHRMGLTGLSAQSLVLAQVPSRPPPCRRASSTLDAPSRRREERPPSRARSRRPA